MSGMPSASGSNGGAPEASRRGGATGPTQPPIDPMGSDHATLVVMLLLIMLVIAMVGGGFMSAVLASRRAMRQWQQQMMAVAPMPPPPGAPLFPDEVEASVDRGLALMASFEPAKAEAAFAQAEAIMPDFVITLDRAIAALNQSTDGAQERAIGILEELLATQPDHPEQARVHYCIGLAHSYLGRPAEALEAFARAQRLRGDDAAVHYQVGQALEQLGRLDEALPEYERAVTIDPLMRSALLGIQRVQARAGREKEADEALRRFVALEQNPRSRLTEFKYTRMGALSEAIPLSGARGGAAGAAGAASATDATAPAVAVDPASPIFGAARPFASSPGEDLVPGAGGLPIPVDLDGDDLVDLFVAGGAGADGRSMLLLQGADGSFSTAVNDLTAIPSLRLAAFADFDNDGRTDALVATAEPAASRLMRAVGEGRFTEVARWGGATDAVWVDLDHDGDVDLLMAGVTGSPAIMMNRGAEGFEQVSIDRALPGAIGDCRRVGAGDLDGDGLIDLALMGDAGCQLWLNDGFWNWRRDESMRPIEQQARQAMVIGEQPETGRPLVVSLVAEPDPSAPMKSRVAAWVARAQGESERWRMLGSSAVEEGAEFELVDLVGDGTRQLLVSSAAGASLRRLDGSIASGIPSLPDARRTLLAFGSDPIPALVEWSAAQARFQPAAPRSGATPGSGAASSLGRLVAIDLRGRTDPSQSMRSNADGIGARWASRAGGRWNGGWILRQSTNPGQGRQPAFVGIGDAPRIDALFIDWPDGVIQSEMALAPGRMHEITQTQRQISSCPLIFAWDGERFVFETDCLGVGGIGYLVGAERDESGRIRPLYAPPRPRESVRIRGKFTPRDGAYELRLAEPMEEACYLDAARLVEWRLPKGWRAVLDERLAINGPEATGEARFHRRAAAVASAECSASIDASPGVVNDTAKARLTAVDGRAVGFGTPHPRFIGRIEREGSLVMTFARAIDSHPGRPALVVHGWVEYPYSQTSFAMWQEHALPKAPSIDALDPATNEWITLVEEIGYPAGMRRESLWPLSGAGIASIPPGCTTLRLRTSMELYLDRVNLVWLEPCEEARRIEHPMVGAEIARCGFPRRLEHPMKRPVYDYDRRRDEWDCRIQPGLYTAFGDCAELVRGAEGALAIFGPGEEIRLRFDASSDRELAAADGTEDRPASGGVRVFVLELEGWCKDMDRYTGSGAMLAPIPMRDGASDAERMHAEALHRRFNSRLNGGR